MQQHNVDPAWDAVRTWVELRGEPKLVWWYIWDRVRHRPDSTWVSYCEAGAWYGKSERSGRRALEALLDARLLEEMESLPGRVRVYVREPREVVSPPRDRTGDNDRPLFDRLAARDASDVPPPGPGTAKSADPPAEVAPQPPADVAPLPPNAPPHGDLPREDLARAAPFTFETENANPLSPLHPAPLRSKESTGSARGNCSAEVAPQPPRPTRSDDPEARALGDLAARRRAEIARLDAGELDGVQLTTMGDALGHVAQLVVRLPGDIDRAGATSRLAARIRRRVGSKLRQSPAVRVARAVVYGELPEAELDAILEDVDAKRKSGTLTCDFGYFVVCCKNAFRRHGLPWPTDGTPCPLQSRAETRAKPR